LKLSKSFILNFNKMRNNVLMLQKIFY